jgi:hypothetical protein
MMDVTMTHDHFGCSTQSSNGPLTHRVEFLTVTRRCFKLKNTVSKKIRHYRQVYVDKTDPVIFLTVTVNTSGNDTFFLIKNILKFFYGKDMNEWVLITTCKQLVWSTRIVPIGNSWRCQVWTSSIWWHLTSIRIHFTMTRLSRLLIDCRDCSTTRVVLEEETFTATIEKRAFLEMVAPTIGLPSRWPLFPGLCSGGHNQPQACQTSLLLLNPTSTAARSLRQGCSTTD